MITKFLSKLKSILFKSSVPTETPLKKAKKTTKSSKTLKLKKLQKLNQKRNAKKIIESLLTLPGVGAKVLKLFMMPDLKQQNR